MAVKSSGTISFIDLRREFGHSGNADGPFSLSDYIRDGALVQNTSANNSIPWIKRSTSRTTEKMTDITISTNPIETQLGYTNVTTNWITTLPVANYPTMSMNDFYGAKRFVQTQTFRETSKSTNTTTTWSTDDLTSKSTQTSRTTSVSTSNAASTFEPTQWNSSYSTTWNTTTAWTKVRSTNRDTTYGTAKSTSSVRQTLKNTTWSVSTGYNSAWNTTTTYSTSYNTTYDTSWVTDWYTTIPSIGGVGGTYIP